MCAFETGIASASGVSGSPPESWPLPGQVGGSTDTGSCNPISMESRNKPRCEHLRSADLLRFPCAQKSCSTFPLGSPKKIQDQRKIMRSIARAAASRPGLSLQLKPCARSSRHDKRKVVLNIQSTVSFAPIQSQSLSAIPYRRKSLRSGGALRGSAIPSTDSRGVH